MANYEIMLIINPKEDFKIAKILAGKIFDNPNVEKLERVELAYLINKSRTASYGLIKTSASGDQIKEFVRKCNLSKEIWRILVINLDVEIGIEKSMQSIQKRKEKIAKNYEERIKNKKPRIWTPYDKSKRNNWRSQSHE